MSQKPAPSNDWYELILTTSHNENIDLISTILTYLGASAITLTDAKDTPQFDTHVPGEPKWEQTNIIGLFTQVQSIPDINKALVSLSIQVDDLKQVPLETKDWVNNWQSYFEPIVFDNLTICQSFVEPERFTTPCIVLTPGLAFGTGTHPTTYMCLKYLSEHPPVDEVVMDFGCGSGILAMAAAKLGAKKVFATDIDAGARNVTRQNADKNHISPNMLVLEKAKDLPTSIMDVLIANILAKPLCDLVEQFDSLMTNKGKIILSGLLESQLETVQKAYSRWFDLTIFDQTDEWLCLIGRRGNKE